MRAIGHSRSFRDVSIILSFAFTLLVGCSNALDYQAANLTDDQRKRVQQILTADQSTILDGWIARNAAPGMKPPAGVTVEQAIKDQEDWLARQKLEKAKAEELEARTDAAHAAEQAEFAKTLSVTLLAKRNKVETDERPDVALEISYDNKSDKVIQGLKGVFILADTYGNPIMDISWSYDGAIAAGKTVIQHEAVIRIDKSVEAQEALWETDFGQLKSVFEINSIVFKDGTSMTARN
jgi:hypothetical protein